MDISIKELTNPSREIAGALERWSNDPSITYLIRPNQNQADLEKFISVTVNELKKRVEDVSTYLIYMEGQLVGEMNFQIDPDHLHKKDPGTAWIGLVIGEEFARGKGIGYQAIKYLEKRISDQDLSRIELGVFEFNHRAINLYTKLGYQEIGRLDNFTYWHGKMWQDIRMEKYL